MGHMWPAVREIETPDKEVRRNPFCDPMWLRLVRNHCVILLNNSKTLYFSPGTPLPCAKLYESTSFHIKSKLGHFYRQTFDIVYKIIELTSTEKRPQDVSLYSSTVSMRFMGSEILPTFDYPPVIQSVQVHVLPEILFYEYSKEIDHLRIESIVAFYLCKAFPLCNTTCL